MTDSSPDHNTSASTTVGLIHTRCARAQASLEVLWRCLRIGSIFGRLAWSPDSRSLLRTV
jgi:hypothetical protein